MDMGNLDYGDCSAFSTSSRRRSRPALDTKTDCEKVVSLASVWQMLLEGSSEALDAFVGPHSDYLLVGDRGRHARPRLAPRPKDLAVVRRALQGQTQKAIAIELGLVGGALSAALGDMHLDVAPRRGSLFMAAAAFVHYERAETIAADVSSLEVGSRRYEVYSIHRPDLSLAGVLTSAELEVVRMVIEGCSAWQIACARKESHASVVEQVATTCGKLGVTTHGELLCKLLELAFPNPSR